MKAWCAMALLVALAGCGRPRWDKPDEAYKSFSAALRKNDYQTAWSDLSSDTKKAIEDRAKTVAAAAGGTVKDDPMLMFFASGYKPLPQGDVKVVSEESQSAVVEVAVGSTTSSQRMHKEGDRWTVDLTDALK
jgi:hypothetical protein